MPSSSSSTDYSRNDSETDVIEVEGGCTTNYASSNDAEDNVQPYKGKPLAYEEWMSRHYEERTAEQERLEVRRSRLERSEIVDNYNLYNSTEIPHQIITQSPKCHKSNIPSPPLLQCCLVTRNNQSRG